MDFTFRDEGGRELSRDEIRTRIQEATARSEARKTEAKRRRNMDVKVTSGTCVCGGTILYLSTKSYKSTDDPRNPVFGAPARGHMVEKVAVVCETCALVYDKAHQRFNESRAEVTRQRQPPGENEEL